MLKHNEIMRMVDKAYIANQVNAERQADEMEFYWVTQWNDPMIKDLHVETRLQFDVLRKGGRQIIEDLHQNPVQISFDTDDEERDDDIEFLDGLYLADQNKNTAIDARATAVQEAIVVGSGAWEIYACYESNRLGCKNQAVKWRPISEAYARVLWDPNAVLSDKSDAKYVAVIYTYTDDGYKDEVEKLTGERPINIEGGIVSPTPALHSFRWTAKEENHIVKVFVLSDIKDKAVTMTCPRGSEMEVLESDLDDDKIEALESEGYECGDERCITRPIVTQYVVSGQSVLKVDVIPSKHIPVVQMYGERAVVGGVEHVEGVTKLAKDPQMLHNFMHNYLANMVSRSPMPKPIYLQDQIAGFERMYDKPGPDNNYPYLLQNPTDKNGDPLPFGPIATTPEIPMPAALAQVIELTRRSVEDVANPGMVKDVTDIDLSGKALDKIDERISQQSMIYQRGFKHALRREAEIWASFQSHILDSPRKMTVMNEDGTKKTVSAFDPQINKETGELEIKNNVSDMDIKVYSSIGESYSSKNEKTIALFERMAVQFAQTDPAMQKALSMEIFALTSGVSKNIKDYASKQLLLMGFRGAENEEEEKLLEESQQNQPDANMVLAQAEQAKAEADMAREQREAIKDQADIEAAKAGLRIDVFKAVTERMNSQTAAHRAGAEIDLKNIQAFKGRMNAMAPTQGSD